MVIYRYNTEKSLGGRSACMSCRNKLSWYELVPVFSYIFLGGRCKTCQSKISMQYPLVEFSAGMLFAALFLKYQTILFSSLFLFLLVYIYYAVLFSLLLVIVVYDIKHKIIPDYLAAIFGTLSFLGIFIFSSTIFSSTVTFSDIYFHIPTVLQLLSGIILALPFALLWLVSGGKWMGLGDAKLVLGLGWLLGISAGLSAIMIAFWIGAITGIILILISKKYRLKSEIPFAPYLILGTVLVFFFNYIFSFLFF